MIPKTAARETIFAVEEVCFGNRPVYSCALAIWPFSESESEGDISQLHSNAN